MRLKFVMAGATLVAAAASCVLADGVQLTYEGQGQYGKTVGVSLGGGLFFENGASSASVWAGELLHSVDGGDAFVTYCTELTQWAGSDEYCLVALEDAPNPGGGMGADKANALYRLFNATSGAETVDSNQKAAAFQAVIWEIVYDFAGNESDLSLVGGAVQITNVSTSLFEAYADLAFDPQGDDSPTVGAYSSESSQDQLITVVPLPGVASMAGLGLAGLATRRRR